MRVQGPCYRRRPCTRACSSHLPRVSIGRSFLAPTSQCTCLALVGPSRSLLGVLGYSCGGGQACFSLSTSCLSAVVFSMHATARLRFCRVRCPALVKTLLAGADADHVTPAGAIPSLEACSWVPRDTRYCANRPTNASSMCICPLQIGLQGALSIYQPPLWV
jgi:hypothetical protein